MVSRYCCLPYCVDKYKEKTDLIPFPTKRKRQLEWLDVLKVPNLLHLAPKSLSRHRICDTHFEPKYWIRAANGRKRVCWNAVPSLNLNTNTKIELTDENTEIPDAVTVTETETPIKSPADLFLEEMHKVLEGCESTCKICCNVISELSRHVRLTHSTISAEAPSIPSANFKCDTCDELFLTPTDLQTHFASSHSTRGLLAPVSTFIGPPVVQKPRRRGRGLKRKSIVEDPLYIPDDMDVDIKPDINNISLSNDHLYLKSDKNFKNTRNKFSTGVKRRRRVVEKSKQQQNGELHKCEYCDRSFKNKSAFFRHTLTHDTSIPPGQCTICNEQFSGYKEKTAHITSTHKDILEKPYICKICDIGFSKVPELDQHFEESHKNYLHFVCKNCDMKFFDESKLKYHFMTTHNENTPYMCEYCSKYCKTLYGLEKHLNSHSHTMEKPYKCTSCEKSYNVEEKLRRHEKMHTSMRAHKCNHCDKSFKFDHGLTKHLKNHENQEMARKENFQIQTEDSDHTVSTELNLQEEEDMVVPTPIQEKHVACGICKSTYLNSTRLGYHLGVKHNDVLEQDSFACKFCEKRFSGGRKLTTHILKFHPKEKPHECKICHKDFTRREDMLDHHRHHTGEKPFTCPYCPKTFRTRKDRVPHIRVHTRERPHKCDQCTKSFQTQFSLTIHKRSHTGERPFMCDQCSKWFAAKFTLKFHMKVHKGKEVGRDGKPNRSYICNEKDCGKIFSYKRSLDIHTKTHRGVKPYTCEDCGKSLSSLYIFVAHCKLHTGDRPFKCEICEKSFTSMSSLKHHGRIHTVEKKHTCEECGKRFLELHQLKQHIRFHERQRLKGK